MCGTQILIISLKYPKNSDHLLINVFSLLLDILLHSLVQLQKKSVDSASAQAKDFGVRKTDPKFNESYTCPLSNTNAPMASDGPVDEIIIITPPKKP